MATQAASGSSTRGGADAARAAVREARTALGNRTARVGFLFVSPDRNLRDALRAAKAECPDTTFLACGTAGELTERGLTHGGVAAFLLAADENEMSFELRMATGVKANAQRAVDSICHDFGRLREQAMGRGMPITTSVMLVDGLNGMGESLVEDVRSSIGSVHEIVGGAAGDQGKFDATWVGSTAGAETNAAVALHVFAKQRWGVGVEHGLTAATAPMRVTKAHANVVYEIDGRAAFDVYREYAQSKKGVSLTPEDAGGFLINNELGIIVFDEVRKARAPLSVGKDGSLACAGPIPQGASVSILGGSREALVQAAERAAREAKKRLGDRPAAGVLLFDCICRGTILAEDFAKEIDAIERVFPKTPIAGFLTYGEIARYSGKLDGWHNTTAVVVAIPS
jgi:hypothetical protein